MALTFPLPLDEFFDGLPIGGGVVDLDEAMEMSENGKGEILTSTMGNRLWKADFEIRSCSYREAEAIKAKLDTLRYPARSLFVRPSPDIGPANDPDGSILGALTVTIANVAGNNRDVLVGPLPAGFVIKSGDYLSYEYGANPIRYALHQIVSDGVVGIDGFVLLETSSFIQPGWVAFNTAIRLIRPFFKAVLVPGSVNPGRKSQQRVEGMSFSVIQTFR